MTAVSEIDALAARVATEINAVRDEIDDRIPKTADITAIVKITQSAYDELDPPVATTLYIIAD
jgi:hypothetical protein